MLRTRTVRLYPSKSQEARFFDYLYLSRRIYNHFLEHRIKAWKRRKERVSYEQQTAMLTRWRSHDARIASVPYMVCSAAIKRLDRAYNAFFGRCQRGDEKKGFPRFKSAGRWNSFESIQQRKCINNGCVLVPKIGPVKCRGLVRSPDSAKVLRVVLRGGKWFAQLVDDDGTKPAVRVITTSIGLDVGLHRFIAGSCGMTVDAPRHFRRLERKLKRASRSVGRKRKGGRNRRKAVARLQRTYMKIADCRKDFTHKLSRRIVNEYDLIAVEQLNIKKLAQTRLAKSILDAAWGQFLFQLRYKAESAGATFVEVNPAYTSQECSGCGELVPKTLKDRVHKCPGCKLELDRDVNAARNILRRALDDLNSTAGRAETGRKPNACGDPDGGVVEAGSIDDVLAHC